MRLRAFGSRSGAYLNADAALQFELQADHVHLRGRAQEPQLGHLGAHLVDGHLNGAEVGLVLVHDGYSLLHVRETVGGCRATDGTGVLFYVTSNTQRQQQTGDAEACKHPIETGGGVSDGVATGTICVRILPPIIVFDYQRDY